MSDSEEWESTVVETPAPSELGTGAHIGASVDVHEFDNDTSVQIEVEAGSDEHVADGAPLAAASKQRRGHLRTRETISSFVARSRVHFVSWVAWLTRCDRMSDSDTVRSTIASLMPPELVSAAAPPASTDVIIGRIADWLAFRFPVTADSTALGATGSLGCESSARLLQVLCSNRLQTPCTAAQIAIMSCALLRHLGFCARIGLAFDLPSAAVYEQPNPGLGIRPSETHLRNDDGIAAAGSTADRLAFLTPAVVTDTDVDIVSTSSSAAHVPDGSATQRPRNRAPPPRIRIWTEVAMKAAGACIFSSSWRALEAGAHASPSLPTPAELLSRPPSLAAPPVSAAATVTPRSSRGQAPRPYSFVLTCGPGGNQLVSDASYSCYRMQPQRWAAAYATQRSHGMMGDADETLITLASAVLSRSLIRDSLAGKEATAAMAASVRAAAAVSPDDGGGSSATSTLHENVSTTGKRRRVSAKSAALQIAAAAEGELLVDGSAIMVDGLLGGGRSEALDTGRGTVVAARGSGEAWLDRTLRIASAIVLAYRLRGPCRKFGPALLSFHAGHLQGGPGGAGGTGSSAAVLHGSNAAAVISLLDSSGSEAGDASEDEVVCTSARHATGAATAPSHQPPADTGAALPPPTFPTKADAYKRHPLFALERFLAYDEIIHPRVPVLGYFRGAPIFPRSSVHRCLTADQWLKQEARVVVPLLPASTSQAARSYAEPAREDGASPRSPTADVAAGLPWLQEQEQPQVVLPAPALRVAPRRRGSAGTGTESRNASAAAAAAVMDTDSADATLALYGVWQTARYEPAPHVPGQPLPRNVHGNIELWGGSRAFLPAGLEWLPTKEARAAAKDVGVECVDVVIGFERAAGRPHPVLLGAVVEAAAAPSVRAAAQARAQGAILKRIGEASRRVVQRWEALVRGVLLARRLREQYSRQGGDAAAVAAPLSRHSSSDVLRSSAAAHAAVTAEATDGCAAEYLDTS